MTEPAPPSPVPGPSRRKKSPWAIVGWVILAVFGMSILGFIGALVIIGSIFRSVIVDSYASGEAARVSIEDRVISQTPEGWAGGIMWRPCETINLDCTSIAGEAQLVPVAALSDNWGAEEACAAMVDYALATGENVAQPSSATVTAGDESRDIAIADCAEQITSSTPFNLVGSLSTAELKKAASENGGAFPSSVPIFYVLSPSSEGNSILTVRWGEGLG